jgi:2-polyprenyl-3-methyl-5-hydroxy-6-metoxy-1,4-benzoquinol methylase
MVFWRQDTTAAINAAYAKLQVTEAGLGATPGFISRTADYAAGAWNYDNQLLSLVATPLKGKTVLDFGAKYGHTIPLLFALGAAGVIAVDVEDEYLNTGKSVLGATYAKSQYLRSERGLLQLQPQTVDLVIVNEVISHINFAYLETFYSEVARILRLKGHVLISDGNNLANEAMRNGLPDVWDAWENGPQGRKTERDVVAVPYIERRARIARQRQPALTESEIDYLAKNTSSLFGEMLANTIDEFSATKKLIERPYRYGTCPTNPGPGGVVMERPFHPADVIRSLEANALTAKQVFHPQYHEAIKTLPADADLTGAFSMFQILGERP